MDKSLGLRFDINQNRSPEEVKKEKEKFKKSIEEISKPKFLHYTFQELPRNVCDSIDDLTEVIKENQPKKLTGWKKWLSIIWKIIKFIPNLISSI